jgi:hypothetical protein
MGQSPAWLDRIPDSRLHCVILRIKVHQAPGEMRDAHEQTLRKPLAKGDKLTELKIKFH